VFNVCSIRACTRVYALIGADRRVYAPIGAQCECSFRAAWQLELPYLLILTGKGFSLILNGKVYTSSMRSCLVHGNETSPVKKEHELKLYRTEASILGIPPYPPTFRCMSLGP